MFLNVSVISAVNMQFMLVRGKEQFLGKDRGIIFGIKLFFQN